MFTPEFHKTSTLQFERLKYLGMEELTLLDTEEQSQKLMFNRIVSAKTGLENKNQGLRISSKFSPLGLIFFVCPAKFTL